jgi:hypothetical protein
VRVAPLPRRHRRRRRERSSRSRSRSRRWWWRRPAARWPGDRRRATVGAGD